MTSMTRSDRNRDLLILGLRAEGVPTTQIGEVFGVGGGTASQVGCFVRRQVHFLSGQGVWGLVEKFGSRTALIGGIDWR